VAGGFFGGALKVEGDQAVEQGVGGGGGEVWPAVGGEDGGVEFVVELAEDGDEAGDAGADGEDAAVVRVVLRDFARLVRTRPHERHVAAQHVPELRQLVDGPAPDKAPEPRDARILVDFIYRTFLDAVGLDELGLELEVLGFRVPELLADGEFPPHAAQFEDVEAAAVLADAFVAEDDGEAVFDSQDED
jgi:hypothetical protein